MLKKILKNKPYYAAMLAIAVPVSVQSLFQASLSVVDQYMVGTLGENAIATVGLGSRVSFIFLVTIAAIASTASILISQYWGKKDLGKVGSSLGGTMLWGAVVTAVFLIPSLALSKEILGIFTTDVNIIGPGSTYLRIIASGYVPMLLIALYSAVLRSTGHVKSTMYAGLLAVVMNTIINYVLIFGKLGFPQLGVYGTAYATTITRFIEAGLLLGFVYINKYPGAFKIKELFDISTPFMKKIFAITSPMLINEFLWALGETTYSIIYGRIGTAQVAAMTLTYPIQTLSIGLFTGVGSAAGIMIGNKLGACENDEAFSYSKKFVKMALTGSMIFGAILFVCSNLYISKFNVSDDVKDTTFKLLTVFSIALCIKVSNMIIGGGVLRSGGKTKYTLYLDMFGTWGIGVPAGFITAFLLKLPIHWVYLFICSEEFVRFVIGLKLMYSKRWMENLTDEGQEDGQLQSV
ncbi:MAG: MATE family efflux transporter [Clostridiaceae bacterium]